MAHSESLKTTLQSFSPDERIRETADSRGLVRRNKKVDVVAFFWTLVLSFGTGAWRSLAELRRNWVKGDERVVAGGRSFMLDYASVWEKMNKPSRSVADHILRVQGRHFIEILVDHDSRLMGLLKSLV